LEFNDVLLYDFFADSPASTSEWRVVLGALDESQRKGISAPRFDEVRHAAIQTELKFLYVGLTRARKHIWIWDSSSTGDAMKVRASYSPIADVAETDVKQLYWMVNGLVVERKNGDELPQFAVRSTAADWAKSGRLLFSKKACTFSQPKSFVIFTIAPSFIHRAYSASKRPAWF
jgi:ATP-dependent exoDNAse (exonuclease V) beta subunit